MVVFTAVLVVLLSIVLYFCWPLVMKVARVLFPSLNPVDKSLEKYTKADPIRSCLIIGGGLGGLTLCQALRGSKIKATIYERDASAVSRDQGYQIGVDQDGVRILKSLDYPELNTLLKEQKFVGFSVIEGHSLELLTQVTALEDYKKDDPFKPGIVDRWRLREILAERIEDSIEWNKKVIKYEESQDKVKVFFEDGTTAEGDFLVGADGINSLIRNQRCPDLQLEHTNISFAFASIPVPSIKDIPLLKQFSSGNMVRALGKNGWTFLMFEWTPPNQPDTPSIWWAMSYRETEDMKLNNEQLMQKIKKDCKEFFHPEIQKLVELTDKIQLSKEYASIKPLPYNPLAQVSRVTLLGDSAHAMTTHRGWGANTAFRDAMDLAESLIAQQDSQGLWPSKISKYNSDMIKRGFHRVKASRQSTESIHAVGSKATFSRCFFRVFGFVMSSIRLWKKFTS